jgi:hypothetical protein
VLFRKSGALERKVLSFVGKHGQACIPECEEDVDLLSTEAFRAAAVTFIASRILAP